MLARARLLFFLSPFFHPLLTFKTTWLVRSVHMKLVLCLSGSLNPYFVRLEARFEIEWGSDLVDTESDWSLHGMPHPRLRTKSGCFKCKIRRKKCDERRPKCSACLKWNFICIWPNSYCQAKATAVSPIYSEKSEASNTDNNDASRRGGSREDGKKNTKLW